MRFERGQMVNYTVFKFKSGISHPVIVLREMPDSSRYAWEVYDIVRGNKLFVADWTLEPGVKFERGQLVNHILFPTPGERTLRPVIVLKGVSDTVDRRSMELYEVYDIANGDNHVVAHWSLEAGVKFQRGDLVRTTWLWKKAKGIPGIAAGPAIVIEARTKNWIKVWIPARNETMVTTGFMLKHYDEARIE